MRNKHPVSGNTKKKSGRGNSPAAFLRGALLAAVAGLLACAVLTAVADPFFHYHAPLWGLAAVQTDKEYQVPGALRHFRYNAVLAGSSVVENNDNRWFDDAFSVHTVKEVRSYGGIADLHAYLLMAFERHQLERVFFNVDPAALTQEPVTTFRSSGCPMYLYDRNPINDVKYLWNKTVLFEKIPYMIAQSAAGYDEALSYNWAEGKDFSRAGALGHYYRMKETADALPENAYERQAEGNIALVRSLVEEHPETKFTFFIPPYSMLWWDNAVRSGEYLAQIKCEEMFIKALLPYPNVEIFDFQNETEITTNLDLYMDTVHFSPQINKYMVDEMAAGRRRLTPENYQAELARTRAFARKNQEENMAPLEQEGVLLYDEG